MTGRGRSLHFLALICSSTPSNLLHTGAYKPLSLSLSISHLPSCDLLYPLSFIQLQHSCQTSPHALSMWVSVLSQSIVIKIPNTTITVNSDYSITCVYSEARWIGKYPNLNLGEERGGRRMAREIKGPGRLESTPVSFYFPLFFLPLSIPLLRTFIFLTYQHVNSNLTSILILLGREDRKKRESLN